MEKTRVCCNKTINLAKQQCPRKSTLLVYDKSERPPPQKYDSYSKPKIATVPTKTIRICTGAELKKMCRPEPCKCPPAPTKAATIMENIYKMFKFGLKSVFLGSILYFTYDAGIWGDSEQTEKFYTNVCHMTNGSAHKEIKLSKVCLAELQLRKLGKTSPVEDECSRPPIDKAKAIYKLQERWNHMVTTIFEGVTKFPSNVIDWYHKKMGKKAICVPIKTK